MSDDKPTNVHILFGRPSGASSPSSPDDGGAAALAAVKLPTVPVEIKNFPGTTSFARWAIAIMLMVLVGGVYECAKALNRIAIAIEAKR